MIVMTPPLTYNGNHAFLHIVSIDYTGEIKLRGDKGLKITPATINLNGVGDHVVVDIYTNSQGTFNVIADDGATTYTTSFTFVNESNKYQTNSNIIKKELIKRIENIKTAPKFKYVSNEQGNFEFNKDRTFTIILQDQGYSDIVGAIEATFVIAIGYINRQDNNDDFNLIESVLIKNDIKGVIGINIESVNTTDYLEERFSVVEYTIKAIYWKF